MTSKLNLTNLSDTTHYPPTRPQFIAWLLSRLDQGDSCTRIGRDLGVTHAAIRRWIGGQSGVSDTVLLLAGRLMAEPRELSAGLGS